MKKNIKFILLLVFIAIVAGFSGYLMKKNNLNDELFIIFELNSVSVEIFDALEITKSSLRLFFFMR